jgi:hypothetical protein
VPAGQGERTAIVANQIVNAIVIVNESRPIARRMISASG